MMELEPEKMLETGFAALLFAAIFLAGDRVHPLRSLIRDRRSIISFGSGMSAAYVFMHLMPEMHGARRAFAESVSVTLPYEGMVIYFLALIGFLASYGLNQLNARQGEPAQAHEDGRAFNRRIGGFAAYVGLMSYLMVRNLEETAASTAMYAVAFGFHFLALGHTLREENDAAYRRVGRWVLAAMALLGWAAGLLFALPHYTLALLIAFVSGSVIMNSAIMELPSEKDGRFLPFLIGGLLYGLILVPLA